MRKSKGNQIISSVIFIVTVVTVLFALTYSINAMERYRVTTGVYKDGGTVVTKDGNLWEVSRCSYAFEDGTKVKVKFKTYGTKSKYDDSIVSLTAVSKNKQLVNDYVCQRYDLRKYKVKYIKSTNLKSSMIHRRKKNKIIYIEVCKSVSTGDKRGLQDGKYTIAYNKSVPKGKRVTSYCIWNPNTTYCDDIVAVVDNGMIR